MSKKKRSKSWMVIIAISIIMLGVCLIGYFIFALPFNDGSGVRDADLFSAFGDFIGGFVGSLFSLSGFLLLVETFKAQRETMRIQNQDIDFQHAAMLQERFETTFFNLLQVHIKRLVRGFPDTSLSKIFQCKYIYQHLLFWLAKQ